MNRFLSLLIILPLFILVAAFAYKNAYLISVDLFLFQLDLPLTAVILISIFIGVIMGYLYNLMSLFKQKKKYRRLKNKKEVLHDLSDVLDKPAK